MKSIKWDDIIYDQGKWNFKVLSSVPSVRVAAPSLSLVDQDSYDDINEIGQTETQDSVGNKHSKCFDKNKYVTFWLHILFAFAIMIDQLKNMLNFVNSSANLLLGCFQA